jgi:Na+-driven multidrug efflux pump
VNTAEDMPNDRKKLFLEGPIGAALIRLAIPIILGNVLQTGYQLTDAFWVGRLGAAAVAAVSVSFPVSFLVIALGAGFGIAGATLSAQYIGAGRQDMVNHVAAQTMMMVTLTSVVLGAAGYVLAPYLLDLLEVGPDVYVGALGFLRVSFVGIIFVFLYGMFQALMRGVGETRTPLMIVFGTVIVNFLLDPLFSQFVLQFPLAYILSKHTSLQTAGLWWSSPITTVALAIVSVGSREVRKVP